MSFINALAAPDGSRRYTLHSHTQFCDGHDLMENFAAAAVAAGFTDYGFSPHSPIVAADGTEFVTPCNLRLDSVPGYFDEVARVKALYGDRCRFYAGMEIDYMGAFWGPTHRYFASLPLEYSIGSVHFIPAQNGEYVDIDGRYESFKAKMENQFDRDIDYVVDTFFAQTHAMLDAGGFEILGHFDKIAQNASGWCSDIEHTERYRRHIDGLIDHIVASDVIVELNTKAYAEHGRMFPSERYLQRLVDARVPVVVNSDAHVPANIDASRDKGFEMLEACFARTQV